MSTAENLGAEMQTMPRGSTPVPDPTELTDKAIAKAIDAITDHFGAELRIRDERLAGIDAATTLRLRTMDNVPALVDERVAHVKEVSLLQIAADSRYASAQVAHLREVDDIRFQAAERLAGRESELNALALAAAFAAQKEASAKEAEYTRIASIKSESATAQAIDKLGELFATQTRGLGDKGDDLKDRVGRIENVKTGSTETKTSMYATVALAISAILAVISVITFILVIVTASKAAP